MAFKKEQEFNLDRDFDGLDPDSGGRKPKLADGAYLVELTECGYAPGYKGGGLTFVAECVVIESDNGQVPIDSARAITISGLDVPKRKAGAYARLKALLAAAVGRTGNEPEPFKGVSWTKLLGDATNEAQALNGSRVRVKTWQIELESTDEQGNPRLFRLYEFSPAE